jgi:hypothetical protein
MESMVNEISHGLTAPPPSPKIFLLLVPIMAVLQFYVLPKLLAFMLQ